MEPRGQHGQPRHPRLPALLRPAGGRHRPVDGHLRPRRRAGQPDPRGPRLPRQLRQDRRHRRAVRLPDDRPRPAEPRAHHRAQDRRQPDVPALLLPVRQPRDGRSDSGAGVDRAEAVSRQAAADDQQQ